MRLMQHGSECGKLRCSVEEEALLSGLRLFCSAGLFAVTKAASGGESTFVSSITIHNELLKRGRKVKFLEETLKGVQFYFLPTFEAELKRDSNRY